MTKILVLHTSVGHGIMITARNIYERLLKSDHFDVRIEDLYKVAPGPLVGVLEKIYFYFTETFPFIWGILYSEAAARVTIPFRMLAASFRYKRVWRVIRDFRPDIVVSTETVPSGITAYLKREGWYQGKLVIVFSDYHLHRFWLYDECDLYLCNIAEQRDALLQLGIPEEKIALTGMIVSEKYLQNVPRTAAAKEFGLDPELPAVLVSGGRRGLLASKKIVQKLLASPKPFQIVVVAGQNEKLKSELERLTGAGDHNLQIFGYVANQEILMSAVDVLVSKPGGPTIAEAVAKGLSVVIALAHPGHEMANMRYLVDSGIGQYGRAPAEVVGAVIRILNKEILLDKQGNYEKLIAPQGHISLTQALERLNIKP